MTARDRCRTLCVTVVADAGHPAGLPEAPESGRPARGRGAPQASGRKTGGGPEGRKASGLLMVDEVLYVWARNLNKDGTGSSLAWSADRAKTWT